jgi:predicted negative regulator of RcsB-dependent stress response
LAEHHDEMEQIEALKRWWLENESFVIAGLVIGIAAVAGWRGWEWHQTRQAEQASALYYQVSDAVEADDAAKAAALWQELSAGYAGTPYAANAALLVAKVQVESGANAEARRALEWALAHGIDAEVKLLARVRLARLLVSDGEAQQALDLLAGVDGGAFSALIEDARGDAHVALGQSDAARKAWQAALDASDGNLADRQLIELKLEALGPAATPTAIPAATPATSGTTP